MKEVRRKKEERGKGRVQSSRVLGRTVVPRVFGLARLVRPLVDIIVVAASVLAPPCIRRTAEGLAVRRAVLHRVQPLHGRPGVLLASSPQGMRFSDRKGLELTDRDAERHIDDQQSAGTPTMRLVSRKANDEKNAS